MPYHVISIEPTNTPCPAALRNGALMASHPRLWAIGDLDILNTPLLSFFCSTKCPGSVIVQVYDLARAMRDSGISVISGFHSPMEKECLNMLLRGRQSIVICPARNIERIRLPTAWRKPINEGRMLVISPFGGSQRRPTAELAQQRNLFVASLASTVVIAHASAGSRADRLSAGMVASGKAVLTLALPENARLINQGVTGYTVSELIDCLLGRQDHPWSDDHQDTGRVEIRGTTS
jgi:predicted Rossmann fold nucleotide-binding protein DprA/Smf involved in DNA uptake